MSPQFKVLSRVFKYVRRTDHTKALDGGGHRYRPRHLGASALSGFDDLPGPKVEYPMVECLEDNSYFLSGCRQADDPPSELRRPPPLPVPLGSYRTQVSS
jgi:hypothetical protein